MIRLGINASRARSGGAVAHLRGVLSNLEPERHDLVSVDCWSHDALLNELPDRSWLNKHSLGRWQKSVPRELFWERFVLPGLARRAGIDILFNVGAGSICPFQPSVTLSQDLLSYEPGEMQRYAYGKIWFRLLALRHIQIASLRNSAGALFLTDYASHMIQRFSGVLPNVGFAPHGVDERFFMVEKGGESFDPKGRPIRCIYVSNAEYYKHQWHVVTAMRELRRRGFNVTLDLIGGQSGTADKKLRQAIANNDPNGDFIASTGFMPHGRIPDLLAEADIFIFASSCENMPVTLLEGMAARLPIACSDRGPMPEILEDAGIYFDPEAPDSIADAIEFLLQDPEKSRDYARRAKALAQQYSWERCAGQTADFIQKTFYKLAER